jgi:hypothetical protein
MLETLGYAIVAGGFIYRTICFAFVYSFSINLDNNLLLYISFEDYLKSGIWLNLFIATTVTLTVLSMQTGFYILPDHMRGPDEFMSMFEWLRDRTKTALSIVFWIVVIAQLYLKIQGTRYEAAPIVTWLFWLSAAMIFVFGMLSIQNRLLAPAIILVGFISVNIYSGYSFAYDIRKAHANVRVHIAGTDDEKITGTLVLPVARGIVILPSDACNPPDDERIHFISWSAIKSVEDLPERNCALPLRQPRPPVT